MRGKAMSIFCNQFDKGITPAHAGKSNRCGSFRNCTKDHPRACGEKGLLVRYSPSIWGSPPRMRGKASGERRCVGNDRITPAHAGKRLKRSRITDCFRCVPLHFRLVSHKLSASNGSRAPPGALPCLPAQNAAPVQAVYNWTGPVFFAVQE